MELIKNNKINCQTCFKTLGGQEELIQTNEIIEQWYFDLTQLELINSHKGSQAICQSCFNDLKYCNEFRSDLIEKQKNFNNYFKGKEKASGSESKGDEKCEVPDDDPLEGEFVVVKIESIDRNNPREIETSDADLSRSEYHVNDLAECPHCIKLFESEVILKHINEKHLKSSVVKKYFCSHCPYTASKLHRLENHCQKLHNSSVPKADKKSVETKPRKQCPTCGIFVKNLSEHQKMVHIQVKRFCCDYCNYSCYFKTKITRHLQRHIPKHLREQFPCKVENCNFFATRKDALKSHILTMHQTVREKVCLCIECGKSFYNKSQLNIHVKAVHEKVKNHLCNLCGKSFFNVKDMEMHVKRHGVKDMACEICGNLFYCSLDLRRHMKVHSEPTIECEVCSKRFYTNSKLKMHIKIRHEGAKDFFCDYCSSRFSQYNNLKRHVNSVHKSLRINCLVEGCNYSVARKDKYKNHLASQHKFLDETTKESILRSVKFE